MSPLEFVTEIRLEHATFLLRTTTLTTDTVAARVGYLSASALREVVRRRRSMTLKDLRDSINPMPYIGGLDPTTTPLDPLCPRGGVGRGT